MNTRPDTPVSTATDAPGSPIRTPYNPIAHWVRHLLVIVFIATSYWLGGFLGLIFAIDGNVSPIWIPSGVALVGMLWFGKTAAVGIFIGSFLGNIPGFSAQASLMTTLLVSISIGLGSVLQAYMGTYVLKRFAAAPAYPFDSVRDALVFVGFAALAACTINATIGATSVTLGGFAPAENYGITWVTWWLGDTIGVMMIGSSLLIWRKLPRWQWRRIAEILAFMAGIWLLLAISNRFDFPPAYFLLPIILLIIVRFEHYGATIGLLLAYGLSVIGIVQGTSILARDSQIESLILLDTFTLTLGVMAFMLAAMFAERRANQAMLEQINTQLESRVQARTMELLEAKEAAESANTAKSRFISTMSHELRTPLTAIMGFTELQLAGLTGELNDEQRLYQERVYSNAQDLLNLINDVLDISKIDSEHLKLFPIEFELRGWLNKTISQLVVLAEQKRLPLITTIEAQLPVIIEADADRLKQIVTNLLSNAIKFTESGVVHLALRLHPQDATRWQIEVRDTGIGIPAQLQSVIFDEFQQGDSSATRKYGGTGLGLAIVRRLVKLMGGDIIVQSRVNEGSTFTVTLPLVPVVPN